MIVESIVVPSIVVGKSGGGPGPSPSILDDAILDFDASFGIEKESDTEKILSWTDKKANKKINSNGASSTYCFMSSINGKDAIAMKPQVNFYGDVSDLNLYFNNHTVIAVRKSVSNGAASSSMPGMFVTLCDSTTYSTVQSLFYAQDPSRMETWFQPMGSPNIFTSNFSTLKDKAVITVHRNGPSVSDVKHDVNNIKGIVTIASTVYTYKANSMQIGVNYVMQFTADNLFSRVLVFDKILTDSEVQEAIDKLAELYSIVV